MRQYSTRVFMFAAAALMLASVAGAQGLDAALQAKLDARVQAAKIWASDPTIVAAVKALNANLPADHAAMTEEKWTELSVLDPFVRSFSKNERRDFPQGEEG